MAFADDCIGDVAEKAVAALKDGDVLLLENTRFHAGEEKNDPDIRQAAGGAGRHLSSTTPSRAAHRAHATTEGVAQLLPRAAGRSMEAELTPSGKGAGQSASAR